MYLSGSPNLRASIGIGLESGSPTMLAQMQKGNTPERYLGAVRRLARLSHDHGLTWAVNVIVGHQSGACTRVQYFHHGVMRHQSVRSTHLVISISEIPFTLH